MAKSWSTAGGVLWNGSRVLLVKNHKDGWTWPKGRVDPGETEEQAAVREVQEESGYIGVPIRKLSTLKNENVTRFYYLMRPLRSSGVHDHETLEVQWVKPGGAKKLLTSKNDLRVLKDLKRVLKSE